MTKILKNVKRDCKVCKRIMHEVAQRHRIVNKEEEQRVCCLGNSLREKKDKQRLRECARSQGSQRDAPS